MNPEAVFWLYVGWCAASFFVGVLVGLYIKTSAP